MNLAAKSGRIVLLKRPNSNEGTDQTTALLASPTDVKLDVKDEMLTSVASSSSSLVESEEAGQPEFTPKFRRAHCDANKNSLSYKEREIAYKEARRRIFGSTTPYNPAENEFNIQSHIVCDTFRPRPPLELESDFFTKFSAAQLMYQWPPVTPVRQDLFLNPHTANMMTSPGLIDPNASLVSSMHGSEYSQEIASPLHPQPSLYNHASQLCDPSPPYSQPSTSINYPLPYVVTDRNHQFAPLYISSSPGSYIYTGNGPILQRPLHSPAQNNVSICARAEPTLVSTVSSYTPNVMECPGQIEICEPSRDLEESACHPHDQAQSIRPSLANSTYDIDFPPL